MILNNKKGFTLIELILVITIVGIVTPIMLSFLLSNINTYTTYSRYMKQHEAVMNVTRVLRKDIEEAQKYKCTGNTLTLEFQGGVQKVWKIETGKLVQGVNPIFDLDMDTDISKSYFQEITTTSNSKTIILSVLPKNTNTVTDKNRNVINPIITEFSVDYKGSI